MPADQGQSSLRQAVDRIMGFQAGGQAGQQGGSQMGWGGGGQAPQWSDFMMGAKAPLSDISNVSNLVNASPNALGTTPSAALGTTGGATQAPASTQAPSTAAPAPVTPTTPAKPVDPLAQYKTDYAAGKYANKGYLDPIAQQIYTKYGQPGNESGDINMAVKQYEAQKSITPGAISLIDPNSWGTYLVNGAKMQEEYKAAGGLGLTPAKK